MGGVGVGLGELVGVGDGVAVALACGDGETGGGVCARKVEMATTRNDTATIPAILICRPALILLLFEVVSTVAFEPVF